MRSFKTFLLIREARVQRDFGAVESILKKAGFSNTTIKNGRVVITTNERITALKLAMKALKKFKPKFLTDIQAKRISSVGVVSLNNGVQIVAKPLGRKNVKEAEEKATGDLDRLIKKAVKENGGSIKVKIGKQTIANVVKAKSEQIKGEPKADIALIDESGEEVGFISHKKEGGAAAFQQYSGLSEKSSEKIYNNKQVKSFIDDIYDYMEENYDTNIASSGMSFKREVKGNENGKKLLGYSVYGSDWNNGNKPFNRNSVHCIGQGDPVLTKRGKAYELTFSEITHYPDDVDWAFEGDYKANFAATFRVGRKIENSDKVLENLRGGIYPELFISGRNAIEL
jgi:hypothetical protein